ncbi:hypothetical protein ACSQ76_11555 [Roseovarius sp. B08]|uniref:hypothetical protein n=1 Tax=Roseovarius sp. B08 TaxID=3449223 RepID=UPI003EDC33A4
MNGGGETGFNAALNDSKAASFFDGGREGVLAFAAVGLICIMLVSQFAPAEYNPIVLTLAVLAVSTVSMIVVARFFARRQTKAREVEADAYRAMIENDRQRQIAEMKGEVEQ